MNFTEPLNFVLEPWLVPTNIIHDPLVTFTAVRGIEPWVKQLKQIQSLNLDSLPNRIFFGPWPGIPFETSMVAPVKDKTL